MNESREPVFPTPPPVLKEGIGALAAGGGADEDMWIDVIRQMDSVYADLVKSQTALEEQHRELEEAHDLIGSVFDGMTDVVVAAGSDGKVQRINGALARIVGRDQKVLIGSPVEELFAPGNRADVQDGMAHVRAGGSIDQQEWHLQAADGALASVSTSIAARRDGSGRFVGFVLVGRPLGELQRAYRELDEAHRTLTKTQEQLLMSEKMAALGRLVAGVAHELNNPISFVFGNMYSLKRYGEAISTYLEATGNAAPDIELDALRSQLRIDRILSDIGPLVDGTLEGAERVRDIVQDLRRFSSNQQEEPESFNFVRLVHTATDWVVKTQRSKPEVAFDGPEELEVTSHKGQLHQIVVNLVQNACDAVAGQDDPRVTIRLSTGAGKVRLEVADNGPGIDIANRAKIFEPFFTTKPIGSGTGLGLYVSYNIAAKLDGQLGFADEPGGGAQFVLTFPDQAEA